MANEKKTLKFQMMMSPEEAETLDDWMFKNRVRSRAEAIRRLWQMGLAIDNMLPKMVATALESLDSADVGGEELAAFLAQTDIDPELSARVESVKRASDDAVARSSFYVMSLLLAVIPLRGGGDVEGASAMAKQIRDRLSAMDPGSLSDFERVAKAVKTLASREKED